MRWRKQGWSAKEEARAPEGFLEEEENRRRRVEGGKEEAEKDGYHGVCGEGEGESRGVPTLRI